MQHQHFHKRRYRLPNCNLILLHEGNPRTRIHCLLLIRNDCTSTEEEISNGIKDCHIVTEIGNGKQLIPFLEIKDPVGILQTVDKSLISQHNTFGVSRRTRCIDQNMDVPAVCLMWCKVRHCIPIDFLQNKHRLIGTIRKLLLQRCTSDDSPAIRLLQTVGNAGSG